MTLIKSLESISLCVSLIKRVREKWHHNSNKVIKCDKRDKNAIYIELIVHAYKYGVVVYSIQHFGLTVTDFFAVSHQYICKNKNDRTQVHILLIFR